MEIDYMPYSQLYPFLDVMQLINTEMPEPYSTLTLTRYLVDWPHLSYIVRTI